MASPDRAAVLHVATIDADKGLDLVDVDGELEPTSVTRWSKLLQGSIHGGATGIAVDLRACRAIAPLCISALMAASAMLKARGGRGVNLVTDPKSLLGRRLVIDADQLPSHTSAMGALLSLAEIQSSASPQLKQARPWSQ